MEIREVFPKSKEIIFIPKQLDKEKIFCGTFFYSFENPLLKNGNYQDKIYLFIINQIKTENSSLDYIPNLIASFLKREFESALQSFYLKRSGLTLEKEFLILENEKLVEASLKKINELIESLVKKEDFELNLGVAFIERGKIIISKIGDVKMLLYRPQLLKAKKIFDIFENTSRLKKTQIKRKEFSNLISGNILNKDKILFFIPNPQLNLRQRYIRLALSKYNQDEFVENLKKIFEKGEKEKKKPLYFCGFHLELGTRKINIEKQDKPSREAVLATEVAKISRINFFKKFALKIKDTANRREIYGPFIILFGALIILIGLIFVFSSQNIYFKKELKEIEEMLKIGESKFILKEDYEARRIINNALEKLNTLKESREKKKLLSTATNLINKIEKINQKIKPELLIDFSKNQNSKGKDFKDILISGEKIFLLNKEKIFEVSKEGGILEFRNWDNSRLNSIKEDKIVSLAQNIKILNMKTKEVVELPKKFNFEPIDFRIYQDNLYFLGQKNIYKISNALIKPIDESEWLKKGEFDNFIAFDLDKRIYVLADNRKLITFFRGEKENIIDLEFDVSQKARIEKINFRDSFDFLIIDLNQKLARLVDKTGKLKVSYDFSIIKEIKALYFKKENSTIYFLSPEGIWTMPVFSENSLSNN